MNDSEILDDVEQTVGMFMESFYGTDNDEEKRMLASFYMGMITGAVMKRIK